MCICTLMEVCVHVQTNACNYYTVLISEQEQLYCMLPGTLLCYKICESPLFFSSRYYVQRVDVMHNGVSTPCRERRLTSFGNGPLLGAHQPPHCIIASITVFSVKAIPSPWVMRGKKKVTSLSFCSGKNGKRAHRAIWTCTIEHSIPRLRWIVQAVHKQNGRKK